MRIHFAGLTKDELKIVLAATIGSLLIGFDIAVFSFFAIAISKNFYPQGDPALALLLTLGSFAVSFIARPWGAMLLGGYADRRGRKAAMLASIALMFLGTLSIATMPTFQQIGIWASIGIFLGRILQGFAAAGEYGAATAFLAELSEERRGLVTSLQSASMALSGVLAAGFSLAISVCLTPDAVNEWGWRLPFVFGLLVVPVGLFLRASMPDPVPSVTDTDKRTPVRAVLTQHKGALICGVGIVALATSVTYLLSYLPTYGLRTLGLPLTTTYAAVFVSFLMQAAIAPFGGAASDRIGRFPIMIGSAVVLLVSFGPSFGLMAVWPGIISLFAVGVWVAIVKSIYSGPLPALLAELFPKEARATGIAVSVNIAAALFGGAAPLVMEYLTQVTGSALAPVAYLSTTALLSLLSLWVARKYLIRKSTG